MASNPIVNMFKIKELRNRLFFTLMVLASVTSFEDNNKSFDTIFAITWKRILRVLSLSPRYKLSTFHLTSRVLEL